MTYRNVGVHSCQAVNIELARAFCASYRRVNRTAKATLRFDEIRRRREYVVTGGGEYRGDTQYLRVEPNDDRRDQRIERVPPADKVWKGKREDALEQALLNRIAAASGHEPWQVWLTLDDILAKLADAAPQRLRWQASNRV